MKNIEIDVNLQIRPSKDLLNKVVISLLDYLLFSRSQIPFHFELFKTFVSKAVAFERKNDWKTEKQLKLATETLEKIIALKRTIESEIIAEQKSFMILFGSTIHTPKESYQITFPEINETILPTFINETTEVKKILLRMIQNDDLKTSDKDQLPTTNVFVLFKRLEPIQKEHPDLNELRNFKLAKSCKKYSIQFRDSSDFEIFDENFQEMSLSEKPSKEDKEAEEQEVWYQLKTYVKGFKDILVNNQSIWN